MTQKISFIYCIEHGQLANETLASIQSLRKFGGSLATETIYCVCPRPEKSLSPQTESILASLNVEYIEVPLNNIYANYPLANKPLACQYIESIDKQSDYFIFLDSDTLIINPLDDIIDPDVDICLSPVLVKNLGVENNNDVNYSYWKKIIQEFDILNPVYTHTLIDNIRILGYWNSGVILIKNNREIFSNWLAVFEKLYASDMLPKERLYHTEQLSLSIVVQKYNYLFHELDSKYNYHISNHRNLNEAHQINDYDHISILHYHKLLQFSSFYFPFPKLSNASSYYNQLLSILKENELFPLPLPLQIRHFFGNLYYNYMK